jgi:hypothetical protein
VIFCLLLLQNLVFRHSFSFCNLVFLFCLCNYFGISSSLLFLQFGICVQFLQCFMEWYFVFRFCKIWYFDIPSAFAIWYFCSVSIIVLVFHLLFNFCNLVFVFSFCNVFWSDILSFASAKSGISTFLQLLQFGIYVLSLQLFRYFIFSSASAIWYLRSVSAIFFLNDILSSASTKSGILTFLQLLPWHLLPKRLFGYVGYLLIWEFSFLILLLCIMTTRVLFRLLTTWFFMSELSTWDRLSSYSSSSQAWHHYFAFCSFFLADCRFLAHSISRFRFLVGKLSMLLVVALWVWGEMLNNIYLVLFIKGRIIVSV